MEQIKVIEVDFSEELMMLEKKLRVINDAIKDTDEEGTCKRWEFGKEIIVYRGDKKILPKGVLAKIFANLGVETNEAQRRMRFYTLFPTETELRHAVTQFKTWHQLINKGMPLRSLRVARKKKIKKRNDAELKIALKHLLITIRKKRKENADVRTNWQPEASSKFKMVRLLDQIERELDNLINDVVTANDDITETG